MKGILKAILLSSFCSIITFPQAQTSDKVATADEQNIFTEINKNGTGGKTSIAQDIKIEELVSRHIIVNENSDNEVNGWRIQIYNSSGKEAREEANDVREKFLNKYPDIKAYVIYQPPYFKIRVGDFRSKQDAFETFKSVVKAFPISYLVPDKVKYTEF